MRNIVESENDHVTGSKNLMQYTQQTSENKIIISFAADGAQGATDGRGSSQEF